jgi:phenylacetate-CoA ligase
MSGSLDFERLYRAAPVWAQNGLASLEGWRLIRQRYGARYDDIAQVVEGRWSLIGSDLVDFQARRLRDHLIAADAAPYWRARFSDHGVQPRADDPFAEVAKLPVLTKAEVRVNMRDILNPMFDRSQLRSGHTSGTTGAGLVFFETADADRERWAVWWRYRAQFGLTRRTRCAVFAGRSIVPVRQSAPPYWRRNYPGRQLLLSGYHLSEDTVEAYWRALREWRPEWLHGYPSFIALFAGLCAERGLPPIDSIRSVTCGAENLLASQRRAIEATFGVRVRQHYGLAESVANVSERSTGCYVVDEDYSYVEFQQSDDRSALRIIGTNWSNPAFPLVRYDTGDMATLVATPVAPGTWREVASFDGRLEDYVILPSGARVGRLDHIFKDLVHIDEAQIYQAAVDRVEFRIVKGPGYDAQGEEAKLLKEARARLGDALVIELRYMKEIPRTGRGKLRLVISEVPSGALDRALSINHLAR